MVWWEENASYRVPVDNDYHDDGDSEGVETLIQTWLSALNVRPGRVRSVDLWGVVYGNEDDREMVTTNLQPRAILAACSVLTNALADATFVSDDSTPQATIYRYKRGDGPFIVIWSNAGTVTTTFEAPDGAVHVMDPMGNVRTINAVAGVVNLPISPMPMYIGGSGNVTVSARATVTLNHGDTTAEKPRIRVTVQNNEQDPVRARLSLLGTGISNTPVNIAIPAKGAYQATAPVTAGYVQSGKRSDITAQVTMDTGATYSGSNALNFFQAVRAPAGFKPDGTWTAWSATPVGTFGDNPDEVSPPTFNGDAPYTGPSDIIGKLRLMWDDQYLYLGVEALDDKFAPYPTPGGPGFEGDCIEFGIQPNDRRTSDAPWWNAEAYLPGGKGAPYVDRRLPTPAGQITDWPTVIMPTGMRGNVNYQVTIPWKDMGLSDPAAGHSIALAVVLDDCDKGVFSPARKMIHWFDGVNHGEGPLKFGDVTLVEP